MADVSRSQLAAWDRAFVWHPFTQHATFDQDDPLIISHGQGHQLFDVDGRSYLDGISSLWCASFGHRHPQLDAAIQAQLEKIAHSTLLGHANETAIRLAKRLAELSPAPLERVFFSDDGSTAVEVALKMAHQYWQQSGEKHADRRRRFITLAEAYHGDTVGAVSLGGISSIRLRFERLAFDPIRLPHPGRKRHGAEESAERLLSALPDILDTVSQEVAALIIEPRFLGAGGILTYPERFVARLCQAARDRGILIIFDEVASGLGRSGEVFASERIGFTPDFICLAKGLTGGYLPLAATLTSARVFDAFLGAPEAGRTFLHGHTYTGNALGSAAALAALDLLEEIQPLLEAKTVDLHRALEIVRAHPHVAEVRQCGLAAGVDVVLNRERDRPYEPSYRAGARVCRLARERGVLLRPLGDTVVLMPPLTITAPELDQIVAAVTNGLNGLAGGGPR